MSSILKDREMITFLPVYFQSPENIPLAYSYKISWTIMWVRWRGIRGVMQGSWNKFWDILMGREIFFKIFEVPQNIFLCTPFLILFL